MVSSAITSASALNSALGVLDPVSTIRTTQDFLPALMLLSTGNPINRAQVENSDSIFSPVVSRGTSLAQFFPDANNVGGLPNNPVTLPLQFFTPDLPVVPAQTFPGGGGGGVLNPLMLGGGASAASMMSLMAGFGGGGGFNFGGMGGVINPQLLALGMGSPSPFNMGFTPQFQTGSVPFNGLNSSAIGFGQPSPFSGFGFTG